MGLNCFFDLDDCIGDGNNMENIEVREFHNLVKTKFLFNHCHDKKNECKKFELEKMFTKQKTVENSGVYADSVLSAMLCHNAHTHCRQGYRTAFTEYTVWTFGNKPAKNSKIWFFCKMSTLWSTFFHQDFKIL